MSWSLSPSDEQLLSWYADILKLCQVPAAEALLRPHIHDFRTLPLKDAKALLGGIWQSMRDAYSSKFSNEFEFVHRLTSRALVETYLQSGPPIPAGPVDAQRFWNAMFSANRLLAHADQTGLILEVRFALASFAYQLLYEGAVDEAEERLAFFASAGNDLANLPTAQSFIDRGYLVDGRNVLRSEERGTPVKSLRLNRIRNAIAHARFWFDAQQNVAEFHDVSQKDAKDTYDAELTFDGVKAIAKYVYLRVSVVASYMIWLQLWMMTAATVPDFIDLSARKVAKEMSG
jgi:hypothetical protein